MPSISFLVRRLLFALAVGAVACIGSAGAADRGATDTDAGSKGEGQVIVLTEAERIDFAKVEALLLGSVRASDARVRTFAGIGQALLDQDEWPAAQRVSVDTLFDQARGSTDPFVLSLLIQMCGNDRLKPKPTCDPVALARQWTVADTQNQVAWLTLASTLHWSGDADAARAAFVRGARASIWHEYYDDGPRTVTAALPNGMGPRARIALQYTALTSSNAWLVPLAAVQELHRRCKEDALREACRRIVDTIDRDGGSMFSMQVANGIGRRSGVDPGTVERRARELDALLFASTVSGLKSWREITDAAELDPQARLWDRRVALGELAWSREVLGAGGPEGQSAADRFHAERTATRERAAADERRHTADR